MSFFFSQYRYKPEWIAVCSYSGYLITGLYLTLDSNECQKLWGDSLLSDPKGVMEGSSPLPPALKNYFFIVYLLYNVVLVLMYSKVDQIYIYISPFFFGFPFHLVTAEHWGEAPVLQSRFSFVIYSRQDINSVSLSVPVSQFILFPSFPRWCPYICSLRLYFCFVNKIICTNFFRFYILYDIFSLIDFTLYDTF